MKLVTYRILPDDPGRLGAVIDGLVVDVGRLGARLGRALPATMLDLIAHGPAGAKALQAALAENGEAFGDGVSVAESDAVLLAPIPRPRKNIFGIGLNYAKHVDESARSLDTAKDLPKEPVIFSKPPTTVIAPGAPIPHNAKVTQQLDWEVELAVVIGAGGKAIAEDQAMAHVFGYTVCIDVSARDCRRAGQWIVSKGQDGFCPMGPCIVTADAVADPHNLDLWLTKNGEQKQAGNTKDMLFRIPRLIADISSVMRLEPGDIIATGTPDGVGAGMEPQEWMWPGDVIECGVEGVGVLRNPVAAV